MALVLLRTGESPPALAPEEQDRLFQGHFAFMGAEAEAGRLVLAGPFGEVKAQEDLRGIFLMDLPTAEAALEASTQDPTTQAGVFRQEAFKLTTLGVLRELPGVEAERQAAREAAGEDMGVPDVRPYVFVTAEDGAAAAPVFNHPAVGGSVVLFGRLGAPREGALVAILAVDSIGEAQARFRVANEEGVSFELSEWYGTPSLAELGRASR